ncbi:MAG: hypothetical protein LBB82_04885 [Treponema sp.]|jgi:hypothetical protein|nr:hypothetical protein [Treponema sp.]
MGMGSLPARTLEACRAVFAKARSHRITAAVAVAVVMVVVLLLIVLGMTRSRREAESAAALPDAVQGVNARSITDDFFLPYEPDFVPDVLLEKEPKGSWTAEDARPYWTDPMEGNAGAWQKRIDDGVDKMLENVP